MTDWLSATLELKDREGVTTISWERPTTVARETATHVSVAPPRRVARGGMVYKCNCLTCKQAVVSRESWYHGMSARTLYTRQGEHFAGYEARKTDNALFKHAQLHHPGENPVFQFEAEKFFPDATSAQIYEGVSINHTPSTEGYLMNSKAEYQQGEVARVVMVTGLQE